MIGKEQTATSLVESFHDLHELLLALHDTQAWDISTDVLGNRLIDLAAQALISHAAVTDRHDSMGELILYMSDMLNERRRHHG